MREGGLEAADAVEDGRAVRSRDVGPHARVGGRDAGRVAKAPACGGKRRPALGGRDGHVHEREGDHVGHVGDHRVDAVMLLGRHLHDREARRTPEVDDDGRILKVRFGQRRHDTRCAPVEGRRRKLEPRLFSARNRMKRHVVTDTLGARVQAHGRDHAAAHAARVRDDGIDGRGAVDLLHDGAHGQHGDREKHQVGVEHALGNRGRHAVGDPPLKGERERRGIRVDRRNRERSAWKAALGMRLLPGERGRAADESESDDGDAHGCVRLFMPCLECVRQS